MTTAILADGFLAMDSTIWAGSNEIKEDVPKLFLSEDQRVAVGILGSYPATRVIRDRVKKIRELVGAHYANQPLNKEWLALLANGEDEYFILTHDSSFYLDDNGLCELGHDRRRWAGTGGQAAMVAYLAGLEPHAAVKLAGEFGELQGTGVDIVHAANLEPMETV